MKTILIAGGTGLLGTALIKYLDHLGDFEIRLLSRSAGEYLGHKKYAWNPAAKEADVAAFDNVTYLVNLAGAGIAEKPWSNNRKELILKSRTDSGETLAKFIKSEQLKPKQVLSASAIGYYGGERYDEELTEASDPSDDFLAEVTKKWEKASDYATLGVPTAHLRIGVVLAKEGGALPKIIMPVKLGLGAALGRGSQWISWVHIEDIVSMIVYLLENGKTGKWNGTAPHPVSNKELTKLSAQILGKPFFLPNVPKWALHLLLGEMATVVTGGTLVMTKFNETDFNFSYRTAEEALKNLLLTK